MKIEVSSFSLHLIAIASNVAIDPGGHRGDDHLVVILEIESGHKPVMLTKKILLMITANSRIDVVTFIFKYYCSAL